MGSRFLVAACLLWSCTATTPEQESDYQALTGTWTAREDTSIVLTLDRVCCGPKPRLEGAIARNGNRAALDPTSFANLYPIQSSDSGMEYVFEIALTTRLDGACAVNGFVQDRSGRQAFTQPILRDSAVLALTLSGRTAHGCDSLGKPMIFERKP